MELKQAVYRRRAVRQYASDPVEKETLLRLIDAAIQAPSAVNEQPWHFTVVRDRALLARISREARAHLSRTSPAAWASPHSQDMLTDADFDIFYHAARAHPDFGKNGQPLGRRGLRFGRGKSHALGLCGGARDVLDRPGTRMARYAGRKVDARATDQGRTCRSDHRG